MILISMPMQVTFLADSATGLRAIYALHRLRAGRSGGGIRFRPYPDTQAALTDVLRLSRAMSYKFALAGLPMGGSKMVILGEPAKLKSRALLEAVGRFVASLDGRYHCGPDVGTTADDMRVIGSITPHVAGRQQDTSEPTAVGVFHAIRATCQFLFGTDRLRGRSIAVQGAGAVGARLCALLAAEGATLSVADVSETALKATAAATGARPVPVDEIMTTAADVLAPCALGGILTEASVPLLRVAGVCGSGNNQLATERAGDLLWSRGIVFVPDYVASAGGTIGGAREAGVIDDAGYEQHLRGIYDTALRVLEEARARDRPSEPVARALAQAILGESGAKEAATV